MATGAAPTGAVSTALPAASSTGVGKDPNAIMISTTGSVILRILAAAAGAWPQQP
ncbi:hypothetical protein HaLaN_15885 [Haematococcus lacustris]|uniref:Uncharacterized protein n=1 Tax=Haematococcus lacustris TaxID=44745 RepID=A0A699ZC59_HAELA|nr:hypothetical protein HaLaN_15885 [Haematococcus lacustris]